jgi:signal transduction histidine kinase
MNRDQKGKHFFKIRSAVHHMTQLLDEVLLMGKVESDQIHLNPVALNLIELAQQVLEEVQPQASPDLKFDVSMQCEVETVWLDEKLIRHVLTNLLTNAIKYSPNGGTVLFEVSCGIEHVLIRVQDQGIGIPTQDQDRLFEPFHRADNVGTIPGTGLGLAITKRAVGLHGGTISFESQVGIGTTFTISIPIQTPGEVEK